MVSPKILRRFRGPLKDTFLIDRVVRHIPGERDRTFVIECFRRDSSGRFYLRDDLTEEQHKRLVELLSRVKKKRAFLGRFRR
ncbi:MAG: hypothetical protein ACOC45_07175 [Alkalispirochaetaceae bacterium]